MVNEVSIEDIIKENEDLIRKNISKKFSDFSRRNNSYDDLYQEGMIALYNAYKKHDESIGDFRGYANISIQNRLKTYVSLKHNKYCDENHLDDKIKKYSRGGDILLSDTLTSNNDTSEISNKVIVEYANKDETTKKIISMLSSGYNQKEIAKELNMKYRVLNNKVNEIRSDLSNILGIKYKSDKRIKSKVLAYGEGFSKEFNSLKECSQYVDADISSIRKICQGKRKTCKSKRLNKKLSFKFIK